MRLPEASYPPKAHPYCTGSLYEEHKRTLVTFLPFVEPTDAIGTTLDMQIAKIGCHYVHGRFINRQKKVREATGTGDSMIISVLSGRTGDLILADIADGLTPIATGVSPRSDELDTMPQVNSDLLFSIMNYGFAQSENYSNWSKTGIEILGQISQSTKRREIAIMEHPSPSIEAGIRQIVRMYIEGKNSHRTASLTRMFGLETIRDDLANAVFGVSAIYIPHSVSRASELTSMELTRSNIGGFGVCRSLADVLVRCTFPSNRTYGTDVNDFYDKLVKSVKGHLPPDIATVVWANLYEKINKIYAAVGSAKGSINFALTEEDVLSQAMYDLTTLELSGGTDGSYQPTRSHTGDAVAMFEALSNILRNNPNQALADAGTDDDLLAFHLSFDQ